MTPPRRPTARPLARLLGAGLLVLASALPARGQAQDFSAVPPASDPTPTTVPVLAPALPPENQPLVQLDWHGQLRARGEGLAGVRFARFHPDLPLHLDLRHGSADPAGGLPTDGQMGTADLRLRLEPVLRVGEWSEVRAQIDALGVLGSTPAEGTIDRLLVGEPSHGPFRGGLQVRRLWLAARAFDLVDLEVGRVPDHFGMGVHRNGGGDLNGDFQSDVDRVGLRRELFGIDFLVARDNLATLPVITGDDKAVRYGLQDSADVIRWVLEARGGKVRPDRGLQWSAALLWTSQDTALFSEHSPNAPGVSPTTLGPNLPNDCKDLATVPVQCLTRRDLRFYTLQAAIDWRLSRSLRLEAEGVFRYGTIGRTSDPSRDALDPLTLVSGGLAGRGTWKLGRQELRLDLGAASGAADGGFGVTDTDNLKQGGQPDAPAREFLSSFAFHRNYRVDGLMFRDVIGAVANAAFLRPAWRWNLRESLPSAWVELGLVGALAVAPEATPGSSRLLGLEPELLAGFRSGERAQGQLRATWLLPGPAFATPGGADAETAWRLEAIWRVDF